MEPITSLMIVNGLYTIFFFGLGVIGGIAIVEQTSSCLDYLLHKEDDKNIQGCNLRDFTKRTYTE
jgi:hypothetical protein